MSETETKRMEIKNRFTKEILYTSGANLSGAVIKITQKEALLETLKIKIVE